METKKKLDTKTKNAVTKILEVLRSINATPETTRYIFKRVREQGKYQVPNTNRKLPDFLNEIEIDYFLTKSLSKDSTTSLLAHMGIFTGLRINEMTCLKISDIDFDNRQLKVVAGKGNKDRYVPLSVPLMQHIKAYLNGREKGFVYVKGNGTQYSKRALQFKVEKLIKDCSFAKHLSTHSLRHTYGTLLRRKGMSLENIQVLLGHSSRKTTEIYTHIELAPVKKQFIEMVGSD